MGNSDSSISLVELRPKDLVNDRWKILSQLGKGGFGAVYEVSGGSKRQEYAMKVESTKETESMIKMEVAVLKSFNKETPPRHACKYYDSGATPAYRYVVMELLGTSLADLRRGQMDGRFSESTAVRVGIQCLEAVEDLHKISFIHRDIKPANYAMGRSSCNRVVYILDFGLARQYINRDGQLREPRKTAGFRGTVRYSSISAHLRQDLGRHDDIWSLLYMLIEFQRGELPWSRISGEKVVFMKKKALVADQLLQGLAQEFHSVLNELQGLHFADTPNYAWFHQQLKAILIRKKYKDGDPFDWEAPSRQP